MLRRRQPQHFRYDVTNSGLEHLVDCVRDSDVRRTPLTPLLRGVLEEKLPSREQVVRVQQLVRLLMSCDVIKQFMFFIFSENNHF